MKIYKTLILVLMSILFHFLFFEQKDGVNFLIFESLLLPLTAFLFPMDKPGKSMYLFMGTTFLSAIFIMLYGSDIAVAVNILSLFMYLGFRTSPELRSFQYGFYNSISQVKAIPHAVAYGLLPAEKGRTGRVKQFLNRFRIILLPSLVVVFFTLLYAAANSRFRQLLSDVISTVNEWFGNISFHAFSFYLFGLVVSAVFLFPRQFKSISHADINSGNSLDRKRNRGRRVGVIDLKKEYMAMVYLLFMLNILIAVLNYIDLDWVWIHYTWDGKELKEFVHQGTYILLMAILASAGIALYVFRENLNFYRKNALLKKLTYLWIAQNMFMTLSVGMRTYRYIEHFNLAHLRIGLLYFLLAVLVFMALIIFKIKTLKSDYYLIRQSLLSAYLIFFMLSPFDWDRIIINYNFKHADTGFVHKDWTMTLSDKTLPIISAHLDFMDGVIGSNSWHNGKATDYRSLHQQRVIRFVSKFEKRSWRSWNYADAEAYELLKQRK